IASNTLESTLWIFPSNQVRAFLVGNISSVKPRALVRINTSPTDFNNSYESVISSLHWLPNSTRLMFLEGGVGQSRLAQVTLASGTVQTLSSAGYDVTQFTHTPMTSIYMASSKLAPPKGTRINAD